MDELISVVIPTFNSEKYVEETIRSVQNQDWRELEIIMMDDGSTDNTLEILNRLAAKDSRIKVFTQPNGKPAKARNNAIRKASGNWIAMIDSDDMWFQGKLRLQYEKTIAAKADLSFTDGYVCINNDMTLRDYRLGVVSKVYEGAEAIQEFHAQNRVPTSSVLIKREVVLKHGFPPEYPEYPMYCEDYLFWTRLLDKGCRFLGIGEPLLLYRVHPESTIGEEIRLMEPLVRVLLLLPGERKEPWKAHLEKTFMRYLTMLSQLGRIQEIAPLIKPVCEALRPGFLGRIMWPAWLLSPRLFISLMWRTRN
jgi:teichuronic acid biosynthesis glycosyltransferase TuaG